MKLILYSIERYKYCIVAIDCFSKWVEICFIVNKSATTPTNWFRRELIPRFEKVHWLWVDAE